MCGVMVNSSSSLYNMSLELSSACNFLVHLIRLSGQNEGLSESQMDRFRHNLTEVLKRRYRDHWFPERPFKGSGYRCIRINGRLDPVIAQAAEDSAISTKLLRKSFPSELTMWIDPKEVSYRIGENGSICVLYEYKELSSSQQPWAPQSIESKVNNNNNNSSSTTTTTTTNSTSSTTTSSNNNNNNSATLVPTTNCSSSGSKAPSCGKESLRNIDYLLDPRRSTLSSMEQLTAYVSS